MNISNSSFKKMKLGIIGKGVVGTAVYDGLRFIGNDVSYYDKKDTSTTINDVLDTEVVFICVPTKMNDNGTCDVSIVREVVEQLALLQYKGIVAVKSTVIPGTTNRLINEFPSLDICFVPEFLREKCALSDFIDNHDVLVVGTTKEEIYKKIVNSAGHIPKKVICVTPTEAEIVKYFNNIFNAMRVTFANNIYEVCNKLDANYQNVFNACILRNNIIPDYLECNDNLRGFGGHCLPKDTSAFSALTKELGLDYITLFDSIMSDNEHYITRNKE